VQQAPGACDADDVAQAAAANREARAFGLQHLAQVLFARVLEVEVHDVGARRHQRRDLPVVEAEDVADHRPLLLVDDTGLRAFLDELLDLFLGHGVQRGVAHADHPQQHVRRRREQANEGPGDLGEPHDRQGDAPRDPLGRHLPKALRNQFAEHDREVGHDDDDQGGGAQAGGGGLDTEVDEPLRQRSGECRLAHDAAQDSDRRDADLDRREEPGRVLVQREGGRGPAVALLDERLQATAPRGHQRDLRHREHAVDEDEPEQEEDFEWHRTRLRTGDPVGDANRGSNERMQAGARAAAQRGRSSRQRSVSPALSRIDTGPAARRRPLKR
jgi:hypothetical protein